MPPRQGEVSRTAARRSVYLVKATGHLKKHTFSVRAISAAGNVDPTPATRTFKVKRRGA